MPKHIKVELDFIPVEERLPGTYRYQHIAVLALSFPGREQVMFDTWASGQTRFNKKVTHWAEIPDLTNNNE